MFFKLLRDAPNLLMLNYIEMRYSIEYAKYWLAIHIIDDLIKTMIVMLFVRSFVNVPVTPIFSSFCWPGFPMTFWGNLAWLVSSLGPCYKTFYTRNLQIFIKKQECLFVSGKPFQLSLMFAGKAGAYPIEAPFRCSTIG